MDEKKSRRQKSTLIYTEYTSINDRLTIEMNRCLEEADVPEWMSKRKRDTQTSRETPKKELLQTTTDL